MLSVQHPRCAVTDDVRAPFGLSAVIRCFALGVLLLLAGCATSGDPYEPFNRGVLKFNDAADSAVLKPIAGGYRAVVPAFAQAGLSNFLGNLQEPWTSVNQLLQGKPGLFASDLARFVVNTTVGVAGLFDVATAAGLEKHREDFGQTLAVWGVPPGPFLMVPFWGPSTARDGIGDIAGIYGWPPSYFDSRAARNVTAALWIIKTRSDYLGAERLLQGDRYLFLRDAFLQNRAYRINDGQIVDDPFLSEVL
ncbi:VacJ family lipoprotein [Pseudohaliea sp.]|uniref:MlaA family lipoprotein n=1 Tax=Pseudohaliea sp. TaxID=2740289 RepID=UPI0032F00B60